MVGVIDGVTVFVGVIDGVTDMVGVMVGVIVFVGVIDGVTVFVGVIDGVTVGVEVLVGVGVGVTLDGVGVGGTGEIPPPLPLLGLQHNSVRLKDSVILMNSFFFLVVLFLLGYFLF